VLARNVNSAYIEREMTGDELKAIRIAAGLTQEELAGVLKVTRVTVSNAERGKPSRALALYVEHARSKGLLQPAPINIDPPTQKAKRKSK